MKSLENVLGAEGLARRFHECYERLAPHFDYTIRPDAVTFDPKSRNGRLMIAVCAELFGLEPPAQRDASLGMERILEEIRRKRQRQVMVHGYRRSRDDAYNWGELAQGAIAYIQWAYLNEFALLPKYAWTTWPFNLLKPTPHALPNPNQPRRELLLNAAALLVAEIERLDRARDRGDLCVNCGETWKPGHLCTRASTAGTAQAMTQQDSLAQTNESSPSAELSERVHPTPYHRFVQALSADSEYAWSWHCNIAVPVMERFGCTHREANEFAAQCMQHMFGIDIKQSHEWQITCRDAD